MLRRFFSRESEADQRLAQEIELLHNSPLVDPIWYRQTYADLRDTPIDVARHYLEHGAAEGRNPGPLFDTKFYLRQNPDVAATGMNPLVHYILYGAKELRDPHYRFDTRFYLEQNPDVAASRMDPVVHYILHGAEEGRLPRIKGTMSQSYEQWIAAHESFDAASMKILADRATTLRLKPRFSIVIPTYNTPDLILRTALDSVLAQAYPYWELCIADDNSSKSNVRLTLQEYARKDARIKITYRKTNGHISEATNTAMELASGDYVCFMDHDDEIAPSALYEFAIKLNEDTALDFIYSDEDKLTERGQRYEPFFKPDWSPEYFEACMYTAHFACYRASAVRKIGGFRTAFNGAQDYDFVLRFTEQFGNVGHVPKILYHWRAIPGSTAAAMDNKDYVIDAAVRALKERLERTGTLSFVRPNRYGGCFDVRRAIEGNPKISIIIPTTGRNFELRGTLVDLVLNCVENVARLSTYTNCEFVIVHDGPLRDSTLQGLSKYSPVLVQYDDPLFNFSKKINLGALRASGDYLLLLNDDTEIISPDWMEAMLSIAQNPQVGVVGAKLMFEDGAIQHAGVAFFEGRPDHVRRGFGNDDPGYFFSTVGQRNYSAVTGACMLSRKDLFVAVRGFDEALTVNYNDIDYCLKIRESGFRVAYAAQAQLTHFESRSRVRHVSKQEVDLFVKRWGSFVRNDPYYSPYFDAHPPNFELKDQIEIAVRESCVRFNQ